MTISPFAQEDFAPTASHNIKESNRGHPALTEEERKGQLVQTHKIGPNKEKKMTVSANENCSYRGSGLSINGSSQNNMSFQVNNNNSWAFNPQNSMEALRPNQGASGLNRGPNSQNSMGFMKQTQGMSTLGTSHNSVRSTSLESIFSTSKNDQAAPKLVPPPLTAVGKGRGRGGGSATTSRSAQPKKPSEQPFFDLL
ncbi:hypothetical protein ACFE04_005118 [Oxalis oulophora]